MELCRDCFSSAIREMWRLVLLVGVVMVDSVVMYDAKLLFFKGFQVYDHAKLLFESVAF